MIIISPLHIIKIAGIKAMPRINRIIKKSKGKVKYQKRVRNRNRTRK